MRKLLAFALTAALLFSATAFAEPLSETGDSGLVAPAASPEADAADSVETGAEGPSVFARPMTGSIYQVVLTGMESASKVEVPTSTRLNGGDDAIRYVAHLNDDGTWTVEIDTALHGGGSMTSWVFADGKSMGLVSYDAPIPDHPGVLPVPLGGSAYRIVVSNLEGASRVQIPVWNQAYDQEDIVWYDASDDGNGIWSVEIDTARHGGSDLICHVYADGEVVGGAAFTAPGASPAIQLTPAGGVRYAVTIDSLWGATRVQVPTWGEANGQTDIIWYDAWKTGPGSWRAEINAANHDNGVIDSHVYADGRGLTDSLRVSRSGLSVQIPGYDASSANYAGLSSKSIPWGPGGSKDASGRPAEPVRMQQQYGQYDACFVGPATNEIYLTFDEGYEAGYTAKILDTLKAKNVRAVFFVTGSYARNNPQLIRRMIDEGHVVGNHSWSHPNTTQISADRVVNDVMELHTYMQKQFGYDMRLFRFPEGAFSERDASILQSLGYTSMFWSFAYKDWDRDHQIGSSAAYKKVTEGLHPGALYLLHAVSSDNANILGNFIDYARQSGYVFSNFNL